MRSKTLKLYIISVFLGVLTGLIASLFQIAILKLNGGLSFLYAFVDQHNWPTGLLSAVISMLMVFIAWFSVQYIAPEASGSGVPEIEGTLLHVRPIFWRRLIPVKFFSGILSISAKMVVGREGPTIQMGGNLGAMLGELFKLTRHRCDTLIAAGSAAGLAAAFNAPLAGVLFVMEEMRNQFNYSFTNFKMVVITCVMATITLNICIGAQPAIQMQLFDLPSLSSLWLFLVFGIIVGFVGLAFNIGLMWTLRQLDKFSSKFKLFYVLLVGLLVGYLARLYPPTVGGGYEIINQALSLSPSISILFLLLVIRFFTTLMCYSTSVPGGIFAPMLALGTLLGLAAFHLFHWMTLDMSIQPGMFAIAGMGALFAATVRSPITGVILVVEMTQNYSLILPLMITCITSTTVVQLANNKPIYTQLLERTLRLEKKSLVQD
ncbi:H(+)/Cl(-) exchange transporter ClcA [Legionella fallonii]|uniref:H(+)/Cl(-) exchange transporter ClcA n=1 Tax=Legionella fallonii LLAP-10 TaxID=1212491 RepID=A0A098G5A8_9GAMM|nr:H(+)/Cl(-) exchange transporter ClcA [Legionella fallonii]CEG57166.1 H(+)/Cl(-) exchange transporter ClcA [Legionella fallonii LLAP-10]